MKIRQILEKVGIVSPRQSSVGWVSFSDEEKARRNAAYNESMRLFKLREHAPPGPTLDACVSKDILGSQEVLPYSTDIGRAMELVHWLEREEDVRTSLDCDVSIPSASMYAGDSNCPHGKDYDRRDHHGYSSVSEVCGDQEAHAICLASLEIVPKLRESRRVNTPILKGRIADSM